MSNAIVDFSFNGKSIKINCLKEDKMKDICTQFSFKINIDLNNLFFLYGGNIINLELEFKNIANQIDNNRNEMIILVYEKKIMEDYLNVQIVAKKLISLIIL